MKKLLSFAAILILLFTGSIPAAAQLLRLPNGDVNYKCMAGRRTGVTDIEINWSAPGVKGREGNIWGTDIAWYDFKVLGFGVDPWGGYRTGFEAHTSLKASDFGFKWGIKPDASVGDDIDITLLIEGVKLLDKPTK